MTDDPKHTTRDAARKRVAEWKDDPKAQKPKDKDDRTNEADEVEGDEE
jgi:hypothetical protein